MRRRSKVGIPEGGHDYLRIAVVGEVRYLSIVKGVIRWKHLHDIVGMGVQTIEPDDLSDLHGVADVIKLRGHGSGGAGGARVLTRETHENLIAWGDDVSLWARSLSGSDSTAHGVGFRSQIRIE